MGIRMGNICCGRNYFLDGLKGIIPNDPPAPPVEMEFIMAFTDLGTLPTGITAWDNISEWNAKLLASYSAPFTSIYVDYDNFIVGMSGARNGILKGMPNRAFYNYPQLYSILDKACITGSELYTIEGCTELYSAHFLVLENPTGLEIGFNMFHSCSKLEDVYFPILRRTGQGMFYECNIMEVTPTAFPLLFFVENYGFAYNYNLHNVNHAGIVTIRHNAFKETKLKEFHIPSLITYPVAYDSLGESDADNNIFLGVIGNTINATFHNSLSNCFSGQPDGDIQTLQANNTVNITWV